MPIEVSIVFDRCYDGSDLRPFSLGSSRERVKTTLCSYPIVHLPIYGIFLLYFDIPPPDYRLQFIQ